MDFGSEYLLPFDCDNVLVLFKWWVLVLRGFLDKDEQRERERKSTVCAISTVL
jgi:hypothetical protein